VAGQIVLVSGTSGAGKTTTCQAFARRAQEPYLMLGMDLLLGSMIPGKYTIFGEKKDEGYYGLGWGPAGWKAIEAMHAMVAAAARDGQNMVVDHLMFIDPPILQDCIWRFADLPVLFVNLRPSRAVLERRVTERKIELPPQMVEAVGGPDGVKKLGELLAQMTPWYYEHAYQNDCFDLELDSEALSPDEICERIEARLQQGPGTAFETLRKRYPRKTRP
jgi:chloramphenicol 3-O-phosphotransferase